MKVLKGKPIVRCLFASATLGALLILSASRVGSSKASGTAQLDFRARSALRSLPVTGIKRLGGETVEILYRNDYEKNITAVVFSVGPSNYIRRDYIYAELEPHQRLTPGATDDLLHHIETAAIIGALHGCASSRQSDLEYQRACIPFM